MSIEKVEPMPDIDIERMVMELAVKVDTMTETLDHQVTLLQSIKDEIAPVLAKIEKNPMFRMMFGGEK